MLPKIPISKDQEISKANFLETPSIFEAFGQNPFNFFGNQFKTVYVCPRSADLEAAYLEAMLYYTN